MNTYNILRSSNIDFLLLELCQIHFNECMIIYLLNQFNLMNNNKNCNHTHIIFDIIIYKGSSQCESTSTFAKQFGTIDLKWSITLSKDSKNYCTPQPILLYDQ